MIFIDKICQNIKIFVKQNDMLRIHSKRDRNWQDLTMCTTYIYVWTRGCLDQKMMNCYFSRFCRKKVPDLIKKVLHNFGWPLGSKPLKSYKDIYFVDNLVRNALLFNIYCQKADFCCCWLSRAPIRVTPRPKLRLSRLFALNPNLYT